MRDAINACAIITFGGELSHRMPQNSLAGISGNCASLHQLFFYQSEHIASVFS
jgi:hypothetical protein